MVMVAVSYATAVPDYDRIKSLTFGTATADDKAKTYASWSWHDVVASGFILVCILGAYLYFRG
jgi:SSS family solute:Na+ symporter